MSKLFDGTRLASWSNQQKAAAGRITEVRDRVRTAGGYAIRFELQKDDVDSAGTYDQRSEVLWGGTGSEPGALNEGQIIYQVFSLYFDALFPIPLDKSVAGAESQSTGHSLYNQLKAGTGSPKYSLDSHAINHPPYFMNSYSDKFPSNWTPSHPPHTRSVWHDFIVALKIGTTDTNGWLNIWYKLATSDTWVDRYPQHNQATAQAASNYMKFGYYRKKDRPDLGRTGELKTGIMWGADYAIFTTLQEAKDRWGAGGGGGTPAPVAAFTFSPASPAPAQSVTADGSTSTGTGLTYLWTIPGVTPSPTTSGVTFSFASAGSYTVTLKVTDSTLRTSTVSQTIVVASSAALSSLSDDFNAVTRNATKWPTVTGTPTFDNSFARFKPTAGDPTHLMMSEQKYLAPGETLIVGPVTVATIESGVGKVETRMVLYKDPVALDYVVAKITLSDVDTVGKLLIPGVDNNVEVLPAAVDITYDPVNMQYFRFVINGAGTTVTVDTSPNGTSSWTTRRVVTPGWTFAGSTDRAAFQIGARQTTTTGVPTQASFDNVGVPPIIVVGGPTGTIPLPAGLQQGDLIVAHVANGNISNTIANLDQLGMFQELDDSVPFSDGVIVGTTNSHRVWAWVKRYDPGTDTAAWSVQFDTAGEYAIESFRVRNADAFAPDFGITGVTPMTTTASTSHILVPTDSPVANARYYVLASTDTDATAGDWGAAPGAMTKLYSGKKTPEGINIAAYAETIAGQGATVQRTLTHAASVEGGFISFFVRPGSGDAPTSQLDALLGAYQTITGFRPALLANALAAATRTSISNDGTGNARSVIYLDPDSVAVPGKLVRYRLRLRVITGDTAPASDFTLSLYPITGSSGANTAEPITSVGAVLSASSVTISAPAANTRSISSGADFAIGSPGYYSISVLNSATLAAAVSVSCEVHRHWV